MLVIKFFRVGKKNQPSFKIVVAEQGTPTRGGRFVEQIGFYNPISKEKVLNSERIKYWISVGAKPTPRTKNLFITEKIIEGKKVDVHNKPKKKEEEGAKPAAAPKAEAKEAPAEKKEEKPAEEPKKEVPAEKKEEPKEAPKEEKPAEPAPSA